MVAISGREKRQSGMVWSLLEKMEKYLSFLKSQICSDSVSILFSKRDR
jgi:hypothetical protein